MKNLGVQLRRPGARKCRVFPLSLHRPSSLHPTSVRYLMSCREPPFVPGLHVRLRLTMSLPAFPLHTSTRSRLVNLLPFLLPLDSLVGFGETVLVILLSDFWGAWNCRNYNGVTSCAFSPSSF